MKQSRSGLPKLGIQNLLKHLIAEVVANRIDVARLGEYSLCNQLLERDNGVAFSKSGYFGQYLVCSARAYNRRQIRNGASARRQAIDAALDDLTNRRWKPDALHLPSGPLPALFYEPSRVDQRLERLLDKIGIAASPVVEHCGKPSRRCTVGREGVTKQVVHLLRCERRQSPHITHAETHQRLLGATQHGILFALGFIVRGEDDNPLVADLSRHEMKQLQRRFVRPLQVLEDDEQWLLRRESTEKLSKAPEQARLDFGRVGTRRRAVLRPKRREIRENRPEVRRAAAREQ